MEAIKKIVVIGPESTGKSTLCRLLAEHYGAPWVPEYAREYLLENGTDYSYEDLLTIAKGQIEAEEKITHRTSPLLIDTDMYVMKVWCEYVFNKCHSWILNRIAERRYDAYLLCDVDLEWVADSLREYPDKVTRERLFHYYKDLLVNQSLPWTIINGGYAERVKKAIDFIDHHSQ